MTKTNNQSNNQFVVFGTRPEYSICLPNIPYAIRLNCKDGGIFLGVSARFALFENPTLYRASD